MKVDSCAWDGTDPEALARDLRAATPDLTGIAGDVAKVIKVVAEGGDDVLLELGERFDGTRAETLRVSRDRLDAAVEALDPSLRAALDVAADNIRSVARAQLDLAPRTADLPQGHR